MTFIADVHRRVAGIAIGPSSLRNMVGTGGVETARAFCSEEDILRRISNRQTFSAELDALTAELAGRMPKQKLRSKPAWGPARKVLNIFLTEATYNIHLRHKHDLARIEHCLELPLDSYVAKGVRRDVKALRLTDKLQRWRGVVHVTPQFNASYQAAALEIAKMLNYKMRYHLDLRYWRKNEQSDGEG